MSKFILNLNSKYRNPFEASSSGPTSFELIINPTQNSNIPLGGNTSYTLDNPIITAFSWPYRSTQNNATLQLQYIWGAGSSTMGTAASWCNFNNNCIYGLSSKNFSTTNIQLSTADATMNVDYYVGCILMLFAPQTVTTTTANNVKTITNPIPGDPTSTFVFQNATISSYIPSTNTVVVQTGFESDFLSTYVYNFDNISPTDSYYNYFIINPMGEVHGSGSTGGGGGPPSGSGGGPMPPPSRCSPVPDPKVPTNVQYGGIPKNLVLLGLNSFLNATEFNYYSAIALSGSPTAALYVQNITKNWVTSISSVETYTRSATLNDITTSSLPLAWGMNDLYQLRQNNNVFTVQTQDSASLKNIPLDAELSDAGEGYTPDTIYYLNTDDGTQLKTQILVRMVDKSTGAILTWSWANRGDGTYVYAPGDVFDIYNSSKPTSVATLTIKTVSNIGVPILVNDGHRIEYLAATKPFYIYVPLQVNLDYYASVAKYTGVYYSYRDPSSPDMPSEYAFLDLGEYTGTYVPKWTWFECVTYSPQLVGIQTSSIGFQQGVCYRIRLVSVAIPNQQVQGINELPAFFPYLLLQLYNTNSITQSTNVLYSNNPNTTRCAFVCHIGNPRNQFISSYIVIRTTQFNIVKWSNIGYLSFSLLLPNGTPLVFNQTYINNNIIQSYKAKQQDFHAFVVTLVSQTNEAQVSATFEFDIIK